MNEPSSLPSKPTRSLPPWALDAIDYVRMKDGMGDGAPESRRLRLHGRVTQETRSVNWEVEVPSDTIDRLMRQGWIERRNACWALTDAGRQAYMQSAEELGDGRLPL